MLLKEIDIIPLFKNDETYLKHWARANQVVEYQNGIEANKLQNEFLEYFCSHYGVEDNVKPIDVLKEFYIHKTSQALGEELEKDGPQDIKSDNEVDITELYGDSEEK